MDLFTALPAAVVKTALEREITKLRDTKAKGLLGVATIGKGEGLGAAEEEEEEDREMLGGNGEGSFGFDSMREWNVDVNVVGGNVVGEEGPGVEGWWKWIAGQL